MFCNNCKKLVKAASFCTACGALATSNIPYARKRAISFKWQIALPIIVSMIAAAAVLYFVFWHESSGDLDARIMSVFRVEGDLVNLTRTGGVRADAREGMGLHAGYAVATGRGSFCYITLDAASIVKMDQTTDISIEQLNDSLLRINITRGQVMVNLQTQAPEHELEAIIGNTVISVRGTLFIAGVYARGEAIITVLDGSVYVNGEPLHAGYTMRVYDGLQMIYSIEPIDLGEADEFLLVAVLDNHDKLQAAVFLDDVDLDELAELIRPVEADEADGVELAEARLEEDEEEYEEEAPYEEMGLIAVGDIIPFGGYDWRVLDVQRDRVLIITEYVIDSRRFTHTQQQYTWETSEFRQWLNSEFLQTFNLAEQTMIAETIISNHDNPWHGTSGGSSTTDRIFLLSIEEVVRYFGDSSQMNSRPYSSFGWPSSSISDEFNENRRTRDLNGGSTVWWLRSPGIYGTPVQVSAVGSLSMSGPSPAAIDTRLDGIRPALWLTVNNAAHIYMLRPTPPHPLVGSWELVRTIENSVVIMEGHELGSVGIDFLPNGTGNVFDSSGLGLIVDPFNWHALRPGWINFTMFGTSIEFKYELMGDYVTLTYRAEGAALVLRRRSTTTIG